MIQLTSITVWRVTLSFRLSFRHNLAERSGTETLLVRIETADGRCGYGQVLPRSYLTGESIDSAIADIRERWWPRIRGAVCSWKTVADVLSPVYADADRDGVTAGYAGVDVATRMAVGLFSRDGAFRRYSEEKDTLELVGVIPATGVRKAHFLARIYKWLGYRRFKVKVGADAGADARRLAAVRKAVGKDAWIAADANAAWEWDEAVERMTGLGKEFGVRLVEEPLTRETAGTANFRELECLSGVDAMADESLCNTADAERLLAGGGPSWWNIRLAKNGGFTGVNCLAEKARAKGIHLYGGILVGETGALAAAGRYSFFETGVECGEYGFAKVFIRNDPFLGGSAGYRGKYHAPVFGKEKSVSLRVAAIPGDIVYSDRL